MNVITIYFYKHKHEMALWTLSFILLILSSCVFYSPVNSNNNDETDDLIVNNDETDDLIVTYTFKANGGIWEDDLTADKDVTGDSGSPVNIPTPSKYGYILDGWNEAVPQNFGKVDKIFSAQWKPMGYTIRFLPGGDGSYEEKWITGDDTFQKGLCTVMNGNTEEPVEAEPADVYYDTSIDLSPYKFDRSGVIFLGWKSQDGTFYKEDAIVKNLPLDYSRYYPITELVAQWKTVICYSDGTYNTKIIPNKTPVGIAIELDDSGRPTKMMHLREKSAYLDWCTEESDVFVNDIRLNTSYTDGSQNWQIICDAVSDENEASHYPAFAYVNSLTEYGGQWYLPAKEELHSMWKISKLIIKTLESLKGSYQTVDVDLIDNSNIYYWTSSFRDKERGGWSSEPDCYNRQPHAISPEWTYTRAIRAF